MGSLFSAPLFEHSLSFHELLRVNDVPIRCTSKVLDGVLQAFRAGRNHQGSPNDGQQRIDLFQGAFLCGYASRNLPPDARSHTVKDDVFFNCAGIKRFVRAMLGMKPVDLEHLFVLVKSVHEPMLEVAVVGALAEAHVVMTLLEAGLTVLESTTDEDVNLSVDLIVPSPDWSVGHVVQVKSDRDLKGIMLRVLDEEDLSPQDPVMYRHLWEKAESFNRAYNVHYTPIIAFSGTMEKSMFHHREHLDIEYAKLVFKKLHSV